MPTTGMTEHLGMKTYTVKEDTENTIADLLDDVVGTKESSALNRIDRQFTKYTNVDNTSDKDKNVNSAKKWATARTITAGTDVTGSVSIDGSSNATFGMTVNTATKLRNGRTIQVDLASISAPSFNGEANITVGVKGILPISYGGTGNVNGTVAKLTTARGISISGGATASAKNFDGSTAIALEVTALDVSKATAGTLPVGRGGTGATTFTSGQALVGSGTGAVTTRAITDAVAETSASLLTSKGAYAALFSHVPTGVIMIWPAATAPSGWLLLNGQAVSRTTYANLFKIVGTTYGAGNGTTTFNLPDMRSRFPLGYDDNLGMVGGSDSEQLFVANLYPFNMSLNIFPAEGGSRSGGLAQYTNSGINDNQYTTDPIGSGIAHNNMPPYLSLAYIIKF